MDRKDNARLLWYITDVALRKESVDRKSRPLRAAKYKNASLSARRAWIEKGAKADTVSKYNASLSARRAWIEKRMALFPVPVTMVALRKESVDRKTGGSRVIGFFICRSPQGERG